VLYELGGILLFRGAFASAMARFRESLVRSRELADPLSTINAVDGVAAVISSSSDQNSTMCVEQAVRLLGATTAQRESRGTPLRPIERPVVEQAQAAARAQLGEAGYARVLAEGRALSLDEAADLAHELAREVQANDLEPRP
jgi:hypothetical protein